MSENKVRYFLHDDGQVVRSSYSDLQRNFEASPYHTEVQVVPVDAIVIRRDELPEGKGDRDKVWFGTSSWNRDYVEANTNEFLAAVAWFRNPPVYEAQVKALADLVDELQEGGKAYYEDPREFARDLVQRGVRVGDA